jgi:hypothetical protein
MSRAFLVIGGAVDLLIALFLLIVFGWILDSCHDTRVLWAGPIMTSLWLIAFVLSAGAPVLGYHPSRDKQRPPASRSRYGCQPVCSSRSASLA